MKIATKLAIAMTMSSLLMVGCTCSKQENPDQVVPMEEPAAPADGAPSEEAAPADPGMAPAPEGTEAPAAPAQ